MKTAVVILEGVTQVVLTPETDFEKDCLARLTPLSHYHGVANPEVSAVVYRGSFYKCNGGWSRYGDGDDSIIVRLSPGEPSQPNVGEAS